MLFLQFYISFVYKIFRLVTLMFQQSKHTESSKIVYIFFIQYVLYTYHLQETTRTTRIFKKNLKKLVIFIYCKEQSNSKMSANGANGYSLYCKLLWPFCKTTIFNLPGMGKGKSLNSCRIWCNV
jgi:hypothetical protein